MAGGWSAPRCSWKPGTKQRPGRFLQKTPTPKRGSSRVSRCCHGAGWSTHRRHKLDKQWLAPDVSGTSRVRSSERLTKPPLQEPVYALSSIDGRRTCNGGRSRGGSVLG